jgi:hypothetical protein
VRADNCVYVPRLLRFTLDSASPQIVDSVFPKGACCVITGGTGGLGVLHARWIVENTECRRIALLSRGKEMQVDWYRLQFQRSKL